jgi:hypothetical protein
MGHLATNEKGVKNPYYYKLGFKPVDRKKLAKNSKGFDYNDLWGSTYDY